MNSPNEIKNTQTDYDEEKIRLIEQLDSIDFD